MPKESVIYGSQRANLRVEIPLHVYFVPNSYTKSTIQISVPDKDAALARNYYAAMHYWLGLEKEENTHKRKYFRMN